MPFVAGIGCLTPHGPGAATLVDAVFRGAPCPVVPAPAELTGQAAGWVASLSAPFADRAARLRFGRTSRLGRLSLVAAADAITGAPDRPPPPRCGVVLGTAFGAHLANEQFYQGALAGEASPRTFAHTLPSEAAAELSIALQLQGPTITLAQGTTAGLDALAEAANLLREDRAAWILAGAADTLGSTLLAAHELDPAAPTLAEGACFFALTQSPPGVAARVAGAASAAGAASGERAREAALQRAGIRGRELALDLAFPGHDSGALLRALGDSHAALPLLALAWAVTQRQLPALVAAEDADGLAAAVCVAEG